MNNCPAAVSDLPETPVDSEDSALLYFSFSLLYFYYNITIILDSNNNKLGCEFFFIKNFTGCERRMHLLI